MSASGATALARPAIVLLAVLAAGAAALAAAAGTAFFAAAAEAAALPATAGSAAFDGAALAASLAGPARTEGVAVQGAVCFVFSGNGAQHAGMARAALRVSAPFRRAMAEVDAALAPLLGWSPLTRLKAGITAEELAATDIAQPLLFAIQVAMLPALAADPR
jgi:acyl transferase domain-containing protein